MTDQATRLVSNRSAARRFLIGIVAWWVALLTSELLVRNGVPLKRLLADPTQAAGNDPFRGALSNVGLLIWGAAGAVLLLAGWAGSSRRREFLLVTGAIILALGVDDAALLHEEAAERFLGLQDPVVYGFYAIVMLFWVLRYRSSIIVSECSLLLVAALALGTSALSDTLSVLSSHIEDTSKLFGLVVLCSWAASVAHSELRQQRETGAGVREALAVGWIDRLLRRYGEAELRTEAAQLEARSGILTAAERDRQRAEERRRREPQLPWRWHGGCWERWSEMDAAFVAADAPGTLVEHAERTGGPVDGQELVFDGERWLPRAP